MADQSIVEIACARAWSAYILLNHGIDENDERREKLRKFIDELCKAGEEASEPLAVKGLKYLRTLDGSSTG